jgi:hypothetical protein
MAQFEPDELPVIGTAMLTYVQRLADAVEHGSVDAS